MTRLCVHSNPITSTGAVRALETEDGAIPQSVLLASCTLSVTDTNAPLAVGVDESYVLNISSSGTCTIVAVTPWGALHGLETLQQLAGDNCTVTNAPVDVSDRPRFPFRGLMIDSARHFLPVDFVEHIIDGMAVNKLNVLHWHIVDSCSFPYVSTRFPALSQKGAYDPRATYTAAQLSGLVAYAHDRGVRIMPEFDIPGHGDWEGGEPSVTVTDGPCKDTLDPTKNETYEFLGEFLTEVTTVFPDEYLFLGGDEVQPNCWSGSKSVQAWMTERGMNTTSLGRFFWQQLTSRVLTKLNRTIGSWAGIVPGRGPNPADLPLGSFGNAWHSDYHNVIAEAAALKFNIVMSGPWYCVIPLS